MKPNLLLKRKILLVLCAGILFFLSATQVPRPPYSGTCCPEDGAICIVSPYWFVGYFYKSYGPCN